jgi:hypothetical protein
MRLDAYVYNVRNRMLTDEVIGTTSATYLYDDVGNRVQETVNGTATYYLIDTANPTGYDQPIEQKSSPTATPSMTYILGDRVLGQANGSGTMTYLLADGQGSTRLLTDASGTVTATLNYDAFGNPLNFNPATIGTIWQFGGDGYYDYASGLTFHSNGRQSSSLIGRFITMDGQTYEIKQDPITGNLYLLDVADPVNENDPTGHYSQQFGYDAEDAIDAVYAEDHPGQNINYGGWARLGGLNSPSYRLKPDILNYTMQTWAEIKPLTPSGAIRAGVSYALYLAAFTPSKYSPDAAWDPSTNTVDVDGEETFFFNAGGIIFYTTNTEMQLFAATLTSVALVQAFLNSAEWLAMQEYSSALGTLGDLIPGLIGEGEVADGAVEGTGLAIDGLLGALGGF